jgi:hypothetical protein
MFGSVGEQSHEASLFNSSTQTTLMLRTGACLTTGLDLPTIRDVALHEAACIFIINFAYVVMAKLTDFPTG